MKRQILGILLAISMLHCFIPVTVNAMEIYVDLTIAGETALTINPESGDSIDNVKSMIEKETGIPCGKQELIFNGKVMQTGRTLADYNVQKKSTVTLVLKEPAEISTAGQLEEGIADDTKSYFKLTDDITDARVMTIKNRAVLIDLNGHVLNFCDYEGNAITLESDMEIEDSSQGTGHTDKNLPEGGVIMGNGGRLIYIDGGNTLYITSGTIKGAVYNAGGVINGGIFEDEVYCSGGTVNGGTFYGTLNLDDCTYNGEYCTVYFSTDGESAVNEQVVVPGQKAAIPSSPVKDGYRFIGWYDGEKLYDFNSPVIKDITLTAKWDKDITDGSDTPVIDDEIPPQTGDDDALIFWAVLFLTGSGIVTGIILNNRKRSFRFDQ